MTTNRRQFLSVAAGSSALISLSPLVPDFLLEAAAQQADWRDDRVLVVLQLSGGNDGLNTVIPYGDDNYYRNRLTLAIGRGAVHKIDDYVGLHPSMAGFAQLLDEGHLAIVQGVGYPNPNRSHFESMDLWHTAHRNSGPQRYGWLGRYLDASSRAGGDVPAMHLGSEKQPLALAAQSVPVPSVQRLQRFRLEIGDPAVAQVIRRVVQQRRPGANELLQFVRRSMEAALKTSERIERAIGSYRPAVAYPGTPLGQKLRTIAQLMDAGFATRIYYLAISGFDTHSNQAQAHAGLLRQVSEGVTAFLHDLQAHGHAERMLLMTLSEFGRRVKENASRGTDHGAAAPMFVAGGRVNAGLVGEHPSLTDLQNGDLKYHIDYRRVYATVLERWLGCDSRPVLGDVFDALPIIG